MRTLNLFAIIMLCVLFQSVTPVSADMSWSMTDTVVDFDGTTVTHQTIHISGNRFAIETDEGMRFIIDLPEDTMTMINMEEQTYSTISLSEMAEKMGDMQKNANKMIEEALSQIPAEQRAQYEALMKQQMGSMEMPEMEEPEPVDFKATGKSEKIAGYKSSQYTGTDENDAKHELWCSKEVSTDEIMSFYETISKIDFFEDMQSEDGTIEYGFPLRTVIIEDDFQQKSEVTDISFDAVAKDLFTVPAGFEKTDFGF